MTPSDMRRRAWRSLQSAELITEEGDDPDSGGYLAGFAAELALKARFCSIKGLAVLPTEKKVRRELKIGSHVLDHLLNLSDSAKVQRAALDSIDWESISDWDNEDRYEPLGHVSTEQARRRIQQTRLLFRALVDHEIVEGLTKVEALLRSEGVVFNIFAWMLHPEEVWKLTVASGWLDDPATAYTRVAHLRELCQMHLAPDLFQQLDAGGFDCHGSDARLPLAIYTVCAATGGGNLRSSVVIAGGALPRAQRNTRVIALDNLRTDSGAIKRAFVIAVETPTGQALPPSAPPPSAST